MNKSRFVSGTLAFFSFCISGIIQIFVVSALIYLLFISAPGVKHELIRSIINTDLSYNENFNGFFYFMNWFKSVVVHQNFGKLMSSGQQINDFLIDSLRITIILVFGAMFASILFASIIIFVKHLIPENPVVHMTIRLFEFLSSLHYIILGYLFIVEFNLNNHLVFGIIILAIGNGMLNDTIHLMEEEYNSLFSSKFILNAIAHNGNLWKHILKPTLIFLLRLINSKLPLLLGGSFIVEYVLNIYGIGIFTIINGVLGMDYNLLLIITALIATIIIVLNKITNSLHQILDPRPIKG